MPRREIICLLLLVLAMGCFRNEQTSSNSGSELLLEGKKLEFYWNDPHASDRGVAVAVDFIDTVYCFLTYWNGIKNPDRIQPYELVGKWKVKDRQRMTTLEISSALSTIQLDVFGVDSNRCQVSTNIEGVPAQLEGRFLDVSLSSESYEARKKELLGLWEGHRVGAFEDWKIKLAEAEFWMETEENTSDTLNWHLSYDGRYIIIPEIQEMVLLSRDEMGFPVSTIKDKLFMTFLGYQDSVYQQFRVSKS